MIGIYKITSPNGKHYIGQTTNYDKRYSAYKNHKCKMPKRSEETKRLQSLNNGKSRVIIQMDLQGNYIAEFRSTLEACRQLGVSRNISSCYLGKLKQSGGF